MGKKRVVILGAGFGGLYTYLYLKRARSANNLEIVLVNKTNYFLFTPMLHEVATGGLNPQHVSESLREALRTYTPDFLQADVTAVDLRNQVVLTTLCDMEYDYLVIALGAETNFYDIPGAEKYALELKNIQDALSIRRRIIDVFELASRTADPKERKGLLQFLIVGGGATGVELVAEISEFIFHTMARLYATIDFEKEVRLILINSDEEILKLFHPSLRTKAHETLQKKHVEIHTGCVVKEVSNDGIRTMDNQFIHGHTIIWVAGVKPVGVKFPTRPEFDKTGRIVVDRFLRVKEYENVSAIGDIASFAGLDGRPLPMFAQVAVKEAKIVAKNIFRSIAGKPLTPFAYKKTGDLISLGQWMAMGDIMGFQIYGRFTWWLWRTVYLFKFASWKKRIQIAIDWTLNLFNPRDTSKL